MKLIIDVGNTRITIALFNEGKIVRQESVEEKEKYSANYFVKLFKNFIASDSVDACYLSSVVPNITYFINTALKTGFDGIKLFSISSECKSNIIYDVKEPSEVGSDIIGDVAIGKEKYGYPLLICDLGTASKVLLINEKGAFSNCIIFPGMTLQMRSLGGGTALLPDMDIEKCDTILANETMGAMNAGVVYSHIYGIEGICQQFEKEIGYKCKRVITGGCACKIKDMIPENYIFDKDFLLEGIYLLGKMNEVE
ncbi:MAG: type III pantothenate kinase [Bacilli bacterium]|nr:type III pantothenate kinase [Bacilli bacterium]